MSESPQPTQGNRESYWTFQDFLRLPHEFCLPASLQQSQPSSVSPSTVSVINNKPVSSCLCHTAHSCWHDHLWSTESCQLFYCPLVSSPAPAPVGQRHRRTAGKNQDPTISRLTVFLLTLLEMVLCASFSLVLVVWLCRTSFRELQQASWRQMN